jgi:hypothetical protein
MNAENKIRNAYSCLLGVAVIAFGLFGFGMIEAWKALLG